MPLVVDQLRVLANGHPDEVGFSVIGDGPGSGDLTLGQWHAASSRLARGLGAAGVAGGDRVALLTRPEDGLSFVVGYAAAHKAGAVAVPVNVRLTAPEIGRILAHCEPSALVVTPTLLPLVADVLSKLPGLRVVVVTRHADTGERPPAPPGVAVLGWDEASAYDDTDTQVDTDDDDLAEILYTSGTTGMPKGVAIRHSNAALVVYAEPTWTGQGWIHASPMSTFAGLNFVYQPLRMGMQVLYLPRFDVGVWLREVERRKPMAGFLVPAMVELLIKSPETAEADLSSLFMVSVGSAPIAPATLLRLQELLPNAAVSNSYSMTEAGTAYCVLPKGELTKRPGSVGKPLPPAEIRVVDPDGKALPPDEVGDVVIKPAGKPRHYYKDEAASAELYSGEWLRTGDLGKFDADGYLYIVGRAKDVIIRGGNNVHAADVESVLYEHPGVREAAVTAIPHDVLGEDVAAFVVRSDDSLTAEELIAFAKERLADYKVPRYVEFRDELPRNQMGKVLKRELTPTAATR